MTSRFFTHLVLVLGLLSSFSLKAQQVSFAFNPSTVTPNVGDTVRLNVVLTNFTNMTSFLYAHEWDANLFDYVGATKGASMPDPSGLDFNNYTAGALIVGWSANGSDKSVPNGTVAYTLALKVKATSTNFWVSFTGNGTSLEFIQASAPITPSFGNVGNPPGGSATPVVVKTSTHSIQASQSVCVGVTADNFTNLTTAKWTMKWDSTILRYASLSNLNTTLGLSTGTNFVTTSAVANGRLSFNWSSATAQTVPTGDTLYKVCFTAIGAGGTSTTVSTLTAGSEILRSSSGVSVAASISPSNGTVSITSTTTSGNPSFSGSTVSGAVGDTVCVSVYAKNFKNIGTATWSMHWDSTKLSLVKARMRNAALEFPDSLIIPASPTGTYSSVNNVFTFQTAPSSPSLTGTLRYFSGLFSGPVTLTGDSAIMFDVCLRINSGAGTTVPFTFNGTPLKILVSDDLGNSIKPINFTSGNIVISNVATPAITATGTATNVNCNAGTDGKVDLTVSGGTGTFTYSWTGPSSFTATTKDIASLKAGKYYVTISSGSATPKVDSFTITEPTKLATTKTITDVSCFGQATGNITLTPSGGTTAYTYAWSSGETTKDIATKAAGQYIVTITDAKGCILKDTSNIAQPTAALNVSPTVTNVNCGGSATGGIVLTVSGGTAAYTYKWSSGETTKDISNKPVGSYTVTVTDSKGCTQTSGPTAIQEPAVITATPSVTAATCGQTDGAISITVANGTSPYTYKWTGPNSYTSTSKDITGLASGSYTVEITDAVGCKITSAAINVTSNTTNSSFTLSNTVTNVKCNGGSTGGVTVSIQNGTSPYTFAWSNTTSQQNLANVAAGTYTLTVTDAKGCITTTSATVAQPNAITVTGVTSSAVIGCVGTITLNTTGGTGAYTYAWTGNGISNTTSKDQANLCPNETFTVKVTDANGCEATKQFTLTGQLAEPIRLIDSTIVSQAGCPGQNLGEIKVSFTGGKAPFTFEWLNTASEIIDRRQSPSGLKAGKYRIRITDAIGQKYLSTELEIKESSSTINITTTKISSETCNGNDGEIILNVTGGDSNFKYVWNDGPTSRDRIGVKAGIYSVTVTDGKNCLADKSNMNVDKSYCPLNVNLSSKAATCFGEANGSITVNITNGEPGYVIRWSATDSINVSNAPIRTASYEIKNLANGSYTVTITDSKNQRVTQAATISSSSEIVINKTVKNDAGNCSGSIVLSITGGQAPYSYVWNDGGTSRDRFNLCSNSILSVTVTDSKGCFKSTPNDTIKASTIPSTCATVTINTVFDNIYHLKCFGDKNASATVVTVTDLGITPPFQYRWDNSETGPTASQLAAGARTVTVIGANGRTCNASITIKAPDEIKANVIAYSDNCALEAEVRGGVAPYSYKWSTPKGDTTKRIAAPQSKTQYYVIVKDKYGCTTDPGVGMVVCQEFCLQGPTVLTPNDDGKNDKFVIERCDYKNVHLQVFNRWGQSVYESLDYIDQWEGYSRDARDGKELPEGVYMYVLTALEPNGLKKVVTNTVSILRQ